MGDAPEVIAPEAPDDAGERPWIKYRVGDHADGGEEIIEILQRMTQCCVFINPQGNPQWEYHETCINAEAASALAFGLIAQVNGAVWPRTARRRLFGIIADALANALNAKTTGDDCFGYFQEARTAVQIARAESLQITYLLSAALSAATIATALMISAMANQNATAKSFLISAGLASLGAMLSVWFRFRQIAIEPFTSHWYTVIGGVSRVTFGALFGVVFVLFHKAGVLLTIIQDQYAIFAAAIAAGFSERLIPELLASFENKLSSAREQSRHA